MVTKPIERVLVEETWACRHCPETVRVTGATEVAHRCPAWRHRWVFLERTSG